jgi:hypothetical protein
MSVRSFLLIWSRSWGWRTTGGLQNRIYTRQEVHKTRYLATGSPDNGRFTRQKISNTGYSQSRRFRKTAIVHVLDKIKRKRQSGSDGPESLEVRDVVGSKGDEKVRGQECSCDIISFDLRLYYLLIFSQGKIYGTVYLPGVYLWVGLYFEVLELFDWSKNSNDLSLCNRLRFKESIISIIPASKGAREPNKWNQLHGGWDITNLEPERLLPTRTCPQESPRVWRVRASYP